MASAIGIGFSKFAKRAARASGQPGAFLLAVAVIAAWAVTGPTTIVTF